MYRLLQRTMTTSGNISTHSKDFFLLLLLLLQATLRLFRLAFFYRFFYYPPSSHALCVFISRFTRFLRKCSQYSAHTRKQITHEMQQQQHESVFTINAHSLTWEIYKKKKENKSAARTSTCIACFD